MASIKPSVPKGTRDFSPAEMAKRNFIFDTIKGVFRKYGYQQIETPSMELSDTLLGKYGDEGDKLIFKILDSGDFLEKLDEEELINKIQSENPISSSASFGDKVLHYLRAKGQAQQLQIANSIAPYISEKALRYDLTVPFARYVVMHQNEITFPFKRFQVQPVWRADRPQKGRYREFFQCDADVVGSDSLLNEAEFVLIYDEALSKLGLKDFTIKINNRKILYGIAESIGKTNMFIPITIAIDKLDKIGIKGVEEELTKIGFDVPDIKAISSFLYFGNFKSNEERLNHLESMCGLESSTGAQGIKELREVLSYLNIYPTKTATVEVDITLARGLNYYTGAIFEVKTNEVAMGSIGGGGRYDDLTGMFGLPNLKGVGISFGADRIYDVMEELKLFPEATDRSTQILICCFDKEGEKYALPLLQQLRAKNINTELYPAGAKIKKQMEYANNKQIPYTVIIGSDEMQSGLLTFKNMTSGEQEKLTAEEILDKVFNS